MKKQCSISGCEKLAVRKGMCRTHHDKLKRYSDPLYVRPKKNTGQCKIDGCEAQASRKAMCNAHYLRNKRYGREERILAQPGTGTINSEGYRIISTGKRKQRIREHRLIMEKHIGRKLEAHEIIHHLNGDRLDNRTENLEITTLCEHNKKHPHPMLGRHHSPESKSKMSASRVGKKHSAETKAKMSASKTGRKHSDESNAKNRAAHLGKKQSKETIAKRLATKLAKKQGRL